MAITVSNIEICSVPVSTDLYNTEGTGATDNRQYFSVLGTDIYDVAGVNVDATIFENDILRITAKRDDKARPGMTRINFYDKANSAVESFLDCGNLRHCYLALGYDDENQKAYFYIAGQYYYTGEWDVQSCQQCSTNGIYGFNGFTRIYELISGSQITPPVQTYTSNGGGATHIAKVTGQLKDLSSHLSDILIVSGGGGGGMLIGDTVYPGADAGGIAGNSDNSADQTTGYAFGQGENG